jgi:predicted Zn-dependent protease
MARGAAQQPGASAAVPRRQADLPLLAAALVMCAAWALTPLSDWVADLVVDTIPHSRDAELGAAAVAAARYTYASDDAGVAKLGRALVAQLPRARRSQFNFTFAVIEEPYVNAFAYPGGAIFVTRRLISELRVTKAELAAVLGHEMGHVMARHSQKAAIKSNVLLWVLNALLREDGDDERETFGENVHEMLLEQAQQLTRLKFSRRHEFEADALGMRFLRAGGHPAAGMISFFDKLLALEAGSEKPVPWFSTHPATQERVRVLRQEHGAS